jgi:hypothetical protein
MIPVGIVPAGKVFKKHRAGNTGEAHPACDRRGRIAGRRTGGPATEDNVSLDPEHSAQPISQGSADRIPLVVVLLAWLAMTIAALGYVARYGSNVPSWDEWDIVPTMTGVQPVTLEWLWSQHNEHRIPVPRLVMLSLFRAFGNDFRVLMVFNVLAMAASALGMIFVVRRLRGRTTFADAFFPILLLNFSHGVNFIWGWEVEFAVSTLLAMGALIAIAMSDRWPTMVALTAVWLLLVLLVGTGAHGVALVPPVAAWLGYRGISLLRTGEPGDRARGILTMAMAVSAVVLSALYLVGYSPVPYHPSNRYPKKIVGKGVQFITAGFGTAVRGSWPFSGLIAMGLVSLAVMMLLAVAARRRADRPRALGLLFFLIAMGTLGLALGMGGRYGFEPRYIMLSVPALCCVFAVLVAFDPWKISPYLQAGMLTLCLLLLPSNTRWGIDYAADLRGHLADFERDMAAGVPPSVLIHRYHGWLHLSQVLLYDYMPLLRSAGVGMFKSLKDDPPFRERPVSLQPVASKGLRWENGTAYISEKPRNSDDPYDPANTPWILFELPEEVIARGIRLTYRHSNESGKPPSLSIYWKDGAQKDFPKEQFQDSRPTGDRANWSPGSWLRLSAEHPTLLTWPCGKVRQIRIHPDSMPCVFQILGLTILEPGGTDTAGPGLTVRNREAP